MAALHPDGTQRSTATTNNPAFFTTHTTTNTSTLTMDTHANPTELRERHKPKLPEPDGQLKQVRIAEVPGPARQRLQQQRERILQFQQRWERIKADLPPQLSRKHSTHPDYVSFWSIHDER